MKRLVLIYGFILFIYACNTNITKPKNLIDKDKMATILADIYIYQQGTYAQQTTAQKVDYYKTNLVILQKHQVDSTQFKKSHAYYVAYPDDYQAILDLTKEKLNQQLPEDERIKDEKTPSQEKK